MQLFSNNAISTLASDILSTDTSLTVQSGDGDKFPVVVNGGDFFLATLINTSTATKEIVKVTSRALGSDVFTIERAQEGTTPQDFSAGDVISLRISAFSLNKLNKIEYIEDYGNSLESAVSLIGTRNVELLITGPITVNSSITIPFNISLSFLRSGIITVSSGYTLTVNSNINAGKWQIFNGSVVGPFNVPKILTEWFGLSSPLSFTDGDTSPSVMFGNLFKEANTAATSITTFDDAVKEQEITVIFTSNDGTGLSYTTIVNGSGIYTKTGANVTPATNTTMKFIFDGNYWYEV